MNATFTSSEPLYESQKELIQKVFKCRNFDYYGLAEKVVWATECECHVGKHLNMEYGITEIVDKDGVRLTGRKKGYVVGTSLINYGMPLIRYKTTDVSNITLDKCACGRESPRLSDVLTKEEDRIYTRDGRMISASVLTHPFKPLKGVEKSQIIQKKLGHIIVKLVLSGGGITNSQERVLISELKKRIGDDVHVDVVVVDDIPRSANGKYRWVISEVGS